jgi:hypothetical protein
MLTKAPGLVTGSSSNAKVGGGPEVSGCAPREVPNPREGGGADDAAFARPKAKLGGMLLAADMKPDGTRPGGGAVGR